MSNAQPATTLFPPPPPEPWFAFWLQERAHQPWYGAVIWRVWATRKTARALLAALDKHAIPVRVGGEITRTGIYLYLWPQMANPCIDWLLTQYGVPSLVYADQIRTGDVWACGRALARLLRAEAQARAVSDASSWGS